MGLPTPAAQAESTLAKALEGRRLQFPSPSGTAQSHPLILLSAYAEEYRSANQPADSSASAAKQRPSGNVGSDLPCHQVCSLGQAALGV